MAKKAKTMRTFNDLAVEEGSGLVTVEILIVSYHFTEAVITCQTSLEGYRLEKLIMSSLAQSRSFELIAGHPALDLVNTLDWRFRDNGSEELLAGYDDLLAFAAQSAILSPKQLRQLVRTGNDSASAQAVVACRELREATAEIFYAAVDNRTPPTSQVKIVEKYFKEARGRQRLVWTGSRLAWE